MFIDVTNQAGKPSVQNVLPHQAEWHRVIKCAEVQALTSLSRTSIYRYEKAGTFPKKIILTPNCIGWRLGEVLEWIASRQSKEV